MTPGMPILMMPRKSVTMIKFQVRDARTQEDIGTPNYSKAYSETVAERLTGKGRPCIVEKVEV